MATQTANLAIYEVNGNTIKGNFESVYEEKNVGHGSRYIAARIIIDACDSLGLEPPAKWGKILKSKDSTGTDELTSYIESCLFETPQRSKTNFTITVTDPEITAFIRSGSWESYYVV